jgi:hypothetical protein
VKAVVRTLAAGRPRLGELDSQQVLQVGDIATSAFSESARPASSLSLRNERRRPFTLGFTRLQKVAAAAARGKRSSRWGVQARLLLGRSPVLLGLPECTRSTSLARRPELGAQCVQPIRSWLALPVDLDHARRGLVSTRIAEPGRRRVGSSTSARSRRPDIRRPKP